MGIKDNSQDPNRRNPLQTQAVIPMEVGVTGTRRATFSEEENDDKLRLNLDYLDEVREEASCRMTKYQ